MLEKFKIRIRKIRKLYFIIFLLNFTNSSKTTNSDYGIYDDVVNTILDDQKNKIINPFDYNQTDYNFGISNWTRNNQLKAMKQSNNYQKLRKYHQTKFNSKINDSSETSNNYKFKRRSDLENDYFYSPIDSYSPYELIYPPAAQLSPIISMPSRSVPLTYRKYLSSANRNFYHHIYPSSATTNIVRRRFGEPFTPKYDITPYYSRIASPSTNAAYLYGTGLASNNPQVTYSTSTYPQYITYPNTHGLISHSMEHDVQNGKEVHNLLPIIAVIGIGAFIMPLFITFFTAMISSGSNCCQRVKERSSNRSSDLQDILFHKTKDVFNQFDKAINSKWQL